MPKLAKERIEWRKKDEAKERGKCELSNNKQKEVIILTQINILRFRI